MKGDDTYQNLCRELSNVLKKYSAHPDLEPADLFSATAFYYTRLVLAVESMARTEDERAAIRGGAIGIIKESLLAEGKPFDDEDTPTKPQ